MSKQTEALKLAQDLRGLADRFSEGWHDGINIDASDIVLLAVAASALEQPAQQDIPKIGCVNHDCDQCKEQQQEPVTVLPDGSAFAVMSHPLPKDHWLYADRQYNEGEYEPVELGKPVLTHELRNAVVSAVRYAIRGATNCGKEVDFDPDALVQNAVYALCGPFTSPPASKPWVGLTEEERRGLREWQKIQEELGPVWAPMMLYLYEAIEAKLREKNA